MIDNNIKFSRADQLTQHLKEYCAKLAVGDKFLSVRRIMDEFNVSQMTVSQAIERLCESGVLEAQDRRGYFVRRNRRYGKIVGLYPVRENVRRYADFAEMFPREAAAADFEYEIIGYERTQEALELLAGIKADAVLFRPLSHEPVSASWLHWVMAAPIPVIFINATVSVGNCCFVDTDNMCSGLLAATHLLVNGHCKLALLLSEPDLPVIRQRAEGFRNCAGAYHLDVEVLNPEIQVGESSPAKSREFMERYLDRNPKPGFTGLFVVSEDPALEVLQVFEERQIAVPEQLSLISLGHTTQDIGRDITTIRTCHAREIQIAVQMIRRHFDDASEVLEQRVVPPEIHIGRTVRNITVKR